MTNYAIEKLIVSTVGQVSHLCTTQQGLFLLNTTLCGRLKIGYPCHVKTKPQGKGRLGNIEE